jgi:hypothetical protein
LRGRYAVHSIGINAQFGIQDRGSWPEWIRKTYDLMGAYEINDDERLTDQEREEKLKDIFARNGDQIVFVN